MDPMGSRDLGILITLEGFDLMKSMLTGIVAPMDTPNVCPRKLRAGYPKRPYLKGDTFKKTIILGIYARFFGGYTFQFFALRTIERTIVLLKDFLTTRGVCPIVVLPVRVAS